MRMNKSIGRWSICLLLPLLLLGCGRKEPPRIETPGVAPEISRLDVDVTEEVVRIRLRLRGGREGIGYQIDRAEMDPHCRCPDLWRRYFELPPSPLHAGKEIVKIIRMEAGEKRYFYRFRAVDGLGHLGPWSRVIRAESKPGEDG